MASASSSTSTLAPPASLKTTPVTLTVFLGSATASILSALLFNITPTNPVKKYVGLSLKAIFSKLQIWRFFTTHIPFGTTAHMVMGLVLLYQFRALERMMGSRQFSSAIIFNSIISTALQLLALTLLPDNTYSACGPLAIIFGLFAYFRFDVPATTYVRVLGVPINDKFWTYLLGVQLLFADYPSTFFTGLSGIVSGLLYRVFFSRSLRLPVACVNAFEALSRRLGLAQDSQAISQGYAPIDASRDAHAQGVEAREEAVYEDQLIPSHNVAMPVHIDPSAIAQIEQLGFTSSQARRALSMTGGNVAAATNMLLDGS